MLGLGKGLNKSAKLLAGGTPAPTHDPLYYHNHLLAWWHAQATYLTVDGSNKVGLWEDKTPNNNNLTQSDGNRKPTWDSTEGAVEFDNDLAAAFDDRLIVDLTSSTTPETRPSPEKINCSGLKIAH